MSFMSRGDFHSAREASLHHASNGSSASACCSQNSRRVLRAMIRIIGLYHAPVAGSWIVAALGSVLTVPASDEGVTTMIRKLKSGEYRLYSKEKDPKTGKRRNLGTFSSREAAEEHEKDVQTFKHR